MPNKPMLDNSSEREVKNFLKKNGVLFVGENDLGHIIEVRNKRPDLLIYSVDDLNIEKKPRCLIEIESFESPGPLDKMMNNIGPIDGKKLSNPIKNKLRHAKAQLKPYCELDIPRVILVDNLNRVGVDLFNCFFSAFFHDAHRREYISAISIFCYSRSFDESEQGFFLRVFHNPYARDKLCGDVFGNKIILENFILNGGNWAAAY